MTQLQKWKTLQSKMVLNHEWCQVRQDEIELPNGKIIDDYFVHIILRYSQKEAPPQLSKYLKKRKDRRFFG